MPKTRSFVPVAEWDDARQLRGLRGEREAMAYLISCGWDIEAHRFRLGRHDIDIVARRGRLVAFVEVKTRRSVMCGAAVEAVPARKRSIVAKVASLWQLRHGRPDDEYRFDLVAVNEGGRGEYGEYMVEHVPDAWRLNGR